MDDLQRYIEQRKETLILNLPRPLMKAMSNSKSANSCATQESVQGLPKKNLLES